MGGHGGLNILPQKKWNVYNYDNRAIVQKDKKEHAEKMQKNYQLDRKHTMQRKFDILKGEDSVLQKNEQKIKQSYKKDSILNHEFKRLAEQNQHVNLFQHQQKIIENRQVLEYHKMKQAEWLKDKDMDYSSKFLGTYNDNEKIPWYAKSKGVIGNDKSKKSESKLSRQRYDMEDLTDLVKLQKLSSRKQYYLGEQVKERSVQQQSLVEKKFTMVKRQQISSKMVKRQSFSNERQRSRQKKYEFIKQRETIQERKNFNQQGRSLEEKQSIKDNYNSKSSQSNQQRLLESKLSNQQFRSNNTSINQLQNDQLQLLRQKRLKRQQKQHKKAEQLRLKLQQSINRN